MYGYPCKNVSVCVCVSVSVCVCMSVLGALLAAELSSSTPEELRGYLL